MKLTVIIITVLVLLFTHNAWAKSVERIEIRAARNYLLTSDMAQSNTTSVMLTDFSTAKLTLAQWMALNPSISLNGQGGLLQSYSLRGFSRARIRTEVDGVPIITDRRAGNSASFISPFLINRIDVQKGPSSTLYGSEAMGGVINLVSSEMQTNALIFNMQTNNQQKELSVLLGDERWQTGFSYRHANNATAASGERLNTHFEQFSGLIKHHSVWNDIAINASWLPSIGHNIGKSSSQYPNERIVHYPEEVHSVSQVSLTQKKQWFVKLYHHYQNWDTETLRVGKRNNITQYQSHTLGGLALIATEWLKGQGRIGLEGLSRQSVNIRETEFDLLGNVNFSKPVVDGQQNNYAIFSDIYWQFGNTRISSGIRYDMISQRQYIDNAERSDNQVNMSASVFHQLSSTQSLTLEWATGFRFPTLSELYFEGETPRGTTLGNAALKPEKSDGLQAKWEKIINVAWQFGIDAYYYQLDNYIQRNNRSVNIRSYHNVDKATIYGAEFKVNWQGSEALDNFSMQWAGQYQVGKDDAGKYLSDLLPTHLSWQTTWHGGDLRVINQLKWQLNQRNVGTGEVARLSTLLWELSLSKQLTSALAISLYANNLTNEYAYSTADENAALIQGRALGIKLDWQL